MFLLEFVSTQVSCCDVVCCSHLLSHHSNVCIWSGSPSLCHHMVSEVISAMFTVSVKLFIAFCSFFFYQLSHYP